MDDNKTVDNQKLMARIQQVRCIKPKLIHAAQCYLSMICRWVRRATLVWLLLRPSGCPWSMMLSPTGAGWTGHASTSTGQPLLCHAAHPCRHASASIRQPLPSHVAHACRHASSSSGQPLLCHVALFCCHASTSSGQPLFCHTAHCCCCSTRSTDKG